MATITSTATPTKTTAAPSASPPHTTARCSMSQTRCVMDRCAHILHACTIPNAGVAFGGRCKYKCIKYTTYMCPHACTCGHAHMHIETRASAGAADGTLQRPHSCGVPEETHPRGAPGFEDCLLRLEGHPCRAEGHHQVRAVGWDERCGSPAPQRGAVDASRRRPLDYGLRHFCTPVHAFGGSSTPGSQHRPTSLVDTHVECRVSVERPGAHH